MRKLYVLLLALFTGLTINAQISVTVTGNTNTTPNLQASYTSLATALADLNAVTAMSGPVVLTCAGGGSETTPPTGLTIGSATLNPVLSSTNTVTINTSGGTSTLNAGVGTATPGSAAPDGILKLVGADHVTIDGLTFTDGNGANPATMEYGVALFKRAAGDGSNNNTIQNCVFNMQRINNATGTAPMIDGAVGILVINSIPTAATTGLTPTNGGTLATNGTNSGNKFYTNTINGGNIGVGLSGYSASAGVGPTPTATTFLGDLGNDVGGSAPATGNSVLNFGGGAATNASAGIRANNQWSVNVSYNTINNNNGSGANHATTLRGIYAQAGTSANATINNNSVTIHGGATTSQVAFIENAIGSTAASNTITINNNTLTGDYLTATSGVFYGIFNTSTPATLNIQGNSVSGLSYSAAGLAGSGVVYPIYVSSAGANVNVLSNTVNNIVRTGTTGAATIGIYVSSGTTQTANGNTVSNMSIDGAGTTSTMYGIQTVGTTVVCNSNNVNNLQVIKTTGTSALYGIYNISSPTNENYNNNDIHTLLHAGTGIVYGINANTAAGTRTVSGNLIYNLSTGGNIIAGMSMALSSPNIFKNRVYDIVSTSTGGPTVAGIQVTSVSGSGVANIYNNLIGDLRAPTANVSGTAPALRGMNITVTTALTNLNLSFNTVYLNGSSSAANFGSTALFVTTSTTATTANLTLRNNILVNASTAVGTGVTSSYQRSNIDLANFNSASNNNLLYAGTPSATNIIFYDGTGSQTLADYKTKVNPRDNAAVTENPPFLSTLGSSANFLHINPSVATQVESGAGTVAGITDDYDGDVRNATPDIGADEGTFTLADISGPAITYTLLANTSCLTGPTLSATITDASGVNIAAGTKPRLYFKRSTDANTFNDNTPGTDGWKYVEASNSSSPFSFTFNYSLLNGGTGVAAGQSIQYFVVAQDLLVNVSINNGTFAASPSSVALTAAAFPLTGTINSFNLFAGLSGTITVGPSGTYPTLTGVGGFFEAINNNGLAGNTIAELENGTITETGAVVLNAISYGCTPNQPLTIKPAGGATTVLTGAVAAGSLIKLNGADYVTIDGSNNGTTSRDLTIQNTTATTSGNAVVWLASPTAGNGSTNNTIKNSIIEGNSSTTSFIGVYIGGNATVSLTAAGNERNNSNTIINNLFRKTQHGLAMYGVSTATPDLNNIVSNNNFGTATAGEGFSLSGMNLDRQENLIVSGNEVRGVTIGGTGSSNYFGIRLLDTKNGQVYNNKVHSLSYTGTSTAKVYGIAVSNTAFATVGNASQLLVYNNAVSNLTSTSTSGVWSVTGILAGVGYGDKYYFNSIYLSGQLANSTSNIPLAAGFAAGDENITATPSNFDFRNNIVSVTGSNGGSTGTLHAIYTQGSAFTGSIINYNDYYINVTGATGHVGRIDGTSTNYTTLAAWQTATSQEANSVSIQPAFVSNTDLHLVPLSNIPLNDLGTPIAGITTDFDGDTRNATTPDMGADEFTLPIVTDVGVTSIVLPVTFCPGSNLVSATIRNYGSTTITSISVDWSVTPGGAQLQANPTINLAPNSSVTVPLGNFTFAAGTIYSITASTLNPNGGADATPANDAFTQNNLATGLNGTYTVGAGGNYTTLTAAVADFNSRSLCGPVVFSLTDATYAGETFPIVINANAASSSTNTLVIRPAAGVATNISGTSGASASSLIRLNGADYVTIDGLNTGGSSLSFENTSTTAGTAVLWLSSVGAGNGASNNTIKNLSLKAGVTQNTATTVTYGIVVAGSTLATTVGSVTAGDDNDNNVIQGNTITKVRYAIYVRGGSTTNPNTGTVINNNIIGPSAFGTEEVGKGGILVREEDGIQITGNTVQFIGGDFANTTGGTDRVGIALGTDAAWPITSALIKNAVITRNTIHDVVEERTFGAAAIAIGGADGVNATNNLVANNMIFKILANGTGGSDQTVAIGMSAGNADRIVYNTAYLTGDTDPNASAATPTSTNFGLSISSTTVANPLIRNNIVYMDLTSSSDATLRNAAINVPTSFAWGTGNSNHNDFYIEASNTQSNIGAVGGSAGTFYNSLAAWQGAVTQDANSISVQPTFVSGDDLHLVIGSNAALDNLGTPVTGVTIDIDNQTRNATTPDMGADEFSNTGILPAQLLTFSGQRAGNTNQLKWVIAQELDVKDYEIERSENGRTWSKVGTVASLGNTSSQRSYGFADNNISGVKQYYRLRQVDRNGSEKLSNIVVITGTKPTILTVSGLFPNPAITKVNILVDAVVKDNVTIFVMDAAGRVVKTQKGSVDAGSNTLQLNVAGLSQGSYLVKITCESNNEMAVNKFIKE